MISDKQKNKLRKILEKISTPEEMKAFDMDNLKEKNDKNKQEIVDEIRNNKTEINWNFVENLINKSKNFLSDKLDVIKDEFKKIPVYNDAEVKSKLDVIKSELIEHQLVKNANNKRNGMMLDELIKISNLLIDERELLSNNLEKNENNNSLKKLDNVNESLMGIGEVLSKILQSTGSNDSIRIKDSNSNLTNPATSDNQTTEIVNQNAIISNQTNGAQKTMIYASQSPMFDAFTRLRTSSPATLFDLQNEYNVSTLFSDKNLLGGGTITHNDNESDSYFSVTNASGDSAISQTFSYFRYTPGKSQLILMSRIFGTPKVNCVQRFGYYDPNNGVFFEMNGTTLNVVQRSKTSGSVVDIKVSQTNWNMDKLDGTGPSGITLIPTNANIYWIDFEALYAGHVRFGVFDGNGESITCHDFHNANSFTVPYTQTMNLPLRIEIYNSGVTSGSTDFKSICSSVITEDGGQQAQGVTNSTSNGITSIPVTTRRPVLSIQPSLTFQGKVNRTKKQNVTFEINTDSTIYYEIIYNATLTGSSFSSVNASTSAVNKDTSATAISGGTMIYNGYAASGSIGSKNSTATGSISLLSKLPLTLDMNGANPKNLSIVCTSFSGTANVSAAFNWEEIY